MKKFILPLLIFLFFPVVSSFAQETPPAINSCITAETYSLCPPSSFSANTNVPPNSTPIDENVPYVTLTTTDLPTTSDKYFYCLKSNVNECKGGDWKQVDVREGAVKIDRLCGSGASKLKTNCGDDGHDYFYGGNTYWVSFAAADNKDDITSSNILLPIPLFVKHYYPAVNAVQEGDGIKLTITGRNIKGGRTDDDSNKFNDYYILIQSKDKNYMTTSCVYVDKTSGVGERTIPLPKKLVKSGTLRTPGNYVLSIIDGVGGNSKTGESARCYGGSFTYYDWPFTINDKGVITMATGKDIPIADPFQKERPAADQLTTPIPPCPTEAQNQDGYCTSVNTALGVIHTDPKTFVADIFRIVLSLAGIVAIVFFIQAGYRLMNSAGNKEKVGQAREQITSAVLGLIFIILSIAIFEFIGIDILHIPGLTR